MSRPDPDDGSVDVEAAWAEIVARWDDPPAADRSEAGRSDAARSDTARSDAGRPDLGRSDLGRSDAGSDATGTSAGTRSGAGTDEPAAATSGGDAATGGPGADETAVAAAAAGAPARPEDVGRDGADDWSEDWEPPRSHVGGERVLRAAQDDERSGRDDLAADAERFVPPEPPPLPRGDLPSRLAWAGVLGAPLFFLVCALFWRDVPGLLVVAGIVAFVAGFGALVVRMPVSRDGDDDGAVV